MAGPGVDPTIQSRVSEMRRPELYGRGVKRVRLVQTHTSWVFLAGPHAYKVKKPVNFGFLDYTTLAARRFFCNEEFRLNRLLSPDIYECVLPITDSGGRLRLGGNGQVIDYCIKMKALPQSSIMTEALRRGKVSFGHIDNIARAIAVFHQHSERGREVAQYGSSEIIRLNWDENFAQTLDFRGRTITYPAFDEIKRRVEQFITGNRELFRQRREGGWVRRCHGDLHSRNVFVVGPSVSIFDCIEFNPRFSCCDVASEIAFMAMDLEYHRRHDLAGFFVERYVVHSGDEGLLRLLSFYKCYRAYVRGKVTSFNLNDPGLNSRQKRLAQESARKYFQLALRYARLLKAAPRLVVVFGLPGVGKTYIAKRLAERIDAFHLSSDSIRKQLVGIPVEQHRFEGYGRGIYRSDISQQTYAEMYRRAQVLLEAGHSVILDATFLREDARERCREVARSVRVPVTFVFADCPENTVRQRLRRRARSINLSDADFSVYLGMKERFHRPPLGKGMVRIDTRERVGRSLARIERALLRR